MDTTVQALKKLYAAMGGTAADVANLVVTPDLIDALCSVAGGSGTSLPSVTSSDNGDVLTVVSGKWAKATPKDYSPFEVEGTLTQVESSMTLTLSNVTGADLYEALLAGKKVKMTITDPSEDVTTVVTDVFVSANADKDTFQFAFSMLTASLSFVAGNIGATETVVFESQS